MRVLTYDGAIAPGYQPPPHGPATQSTWVEGVGYQTVTIASESANSPAIVSNYPPPAATDSYRSPVPVADTARPRSADTGTAAQQPVLDTTSSATPPVSVTADNSPAATPAPELPVLTAEAASGFQPNAAPGPAHFN